MGWGGGSASVEAISLDAVPVGAVSGTNADGAMSSVAARANAAGRRCGSGTRPLMGRGDGSASVDAASVIAPAGCGALKVGGPPAFGMGHAGAAAVVPDPFVARRPVMPAGLATVGRPSASGDAIGAVAVGEPPWAGFSTAAPAITGTGGGGGGGPVTGAAAEPPESGDGVGVLLAVLAVSASAAAGAGGVTEGGGGLAANGIAGGGV